MNFVLWDTQKFKSLILNKHTFIILRYFIYCFNFAETLVEFWRDFKLILNTHPEWILSDNLDGLSWVEQRFVWNEAIVENATNMYVYLLYLHMKQSSSERTQFNKILNSSGCLTVLQKQWNELSKMFKS